MEVSESFAFIDDAEQEAVDKLLSTTRQLVEAVLAVEFRLAALASLTEKFGTPTPSERRSSSRRRATGWR